MDCPRTDGVCPYCEAEQDDDCPLADLSPGLTEARPVCPLNGDVAAIEECESCQ